MPRKKMKIKRGDFVKTENAFTEIFIKPIDFGETEVDQDSLKNQVKIIYEDTDKSIKKLVKDHISQHGDRSNEIEVEIDPTKLRYRNAILEPSTKQPFDVVRLAKIFLAEKGSKLAVSTMKQYTAEINHFVQWLHMQVPAVDVLSDLTHDHMVLYVIDASYGRNPGGRDAALRPIKTFLYWAERHPNRPPTWNAPVSAIGGLRTPLPDVHVATDNEVRALLNTFHGTSYPAIRDRAFFLMLVYSGCRAEEIQSIKRSNIDLKRNTVYLHVAKGGKGRSVVFAPAVAEALENLFKIEKYQSE